MEICLYWLQVVNAVNEYWAFNPKYMTIVKRILIIALIVLPHYLSVDLANAALDTRAKTNQLSKQTNQSLDYWQ